MRTNSSREDYLVTILRLSNEKDFVRSIDIARKMNFSKPSVSIAMNKLQEEGLAQISNHGHILLTSQGKEIAEKVYERHLKIVKLLISLGVSEEAAKEDASKLEHDFSDETWAVIKQHIENVIGKID